MILETINSPEDLKKIKKKDLRILAEEIRKKMISVVSQQGGHLGPSLGTVELSIVLHYVFNSPKDKIIWDVGHQAYTHKMLTGRNKRIYSIRGENGLSGFPKRSESEHDVFGVGHSSTSISAALGMRVGAQLNDNNNKVVAVIGDGSMTGGLAYEGLNNLRSNINSSKNLVVILNDNGMSISPNVGGLSLMLSRLIPGTIYYRIREEFKRILSDRTRTLRFLKKVKHGIKNFLVPGGFFESLGLRYMGPFDGHDISILIRVLSQIKNNKQDIPVLLHVRTIKGKGYQFAETAPVQYHGVSKFDQSKGVLKKETNGKAPYTEVFGTAVCDLAKENSKVVAITAAMATGTGLIEYSEKFPKRFFDVGIAEGHAVTFAAGLATEGLIPIVAIYSTFLQRSYDQIIHDVCLQKLSVIFCLDRAGFVGEDGPTHHGTFDLSYLRLIPDIIIMAPENAQELRNMLYSATRYNLPVAIRYPRASTSTNNIDKRFQFIPVGETRILFMADFPSAKIKILILSVGTMGEKAINIAKFFASENISVKVMDVRFVKPLPKTVIESIKDYDLAFSIEENSVAGGFGSALYEKLSSVDSIQLQKLNIMGIEDTFFEHGSREAQLRMCNLDEKSLLKRMMLIVIDRLSKRKVLSRETTNKYKDIASNINDYEKRPH